MTSWRLRLSVIRMRKAKIVQPSGAANKASTLALASAAPASKAIQRVVMARAIDEIIAPSTIRRKVITRPPSRNGSPASGSIPALRLDALRLAGGDFQAATASRTNAAPIAQSAMTVMPHAPAKADPAATEIARSNQPAAFRSRERPGLAQETRKTNMAATALADPAAKSISSAIRNGSLPCP
ncbi:hypothetical protein [Sphingopyxis sp. BSNA05]|uniref:hypothetical protein n=1 Tax=Sphingopyxis sp. BSNA05 TaxID=1236614 RepID=UPI001565781D|nr:hypothetical protein [Sphingopyxis sp. BSNA05]